MRKLSYTWEDVLEEKFVRTTFTLEQLEDEAEEQKKQREEMERKNRRMNAKTPSGV